MKYLFIYNRIDWRTCSIISIDEFGLAYSQLYNKIKQEYEILCKLKSIYDKSIDKIKIRQKDGCNIFVDKNDNINFQRVIQHNYQSMINFDQYEILSNMGLYSISMSPFFREGKGLRENMFKSVYDISFIKGLYSKTTPKFNPFICNINSEEDNYENFNYLKFLSGFDDYPLDIDEIQVCLDKLKLYNETIKFETRRKKGDKFIKTILPNWWVSIHQFILERFLATNFINVCYYFKKKHNEYIWRYTYPLIKELMVSPFISSRIFIINSLDDIILRLEEVNKSPIEVLKFIEKFVLMCFKCLEYGFFIRINKSFDKEFFYYYYYNFYQKVNGNFAPNTYEFLKSNANDIDYKRFVKNYYRTFLRESYNLIKYRNFKEIYYL